MRKHDTEGRLDDFSTQRPHSFEAGTRSSPLKRPAIPHILTIKIHAAPIHQKARPGRLPSAPDGLSDWWPHRAHNKRMHLSKPNRDARPGVAIDRLRS